jgi:hypothetical protein
MVVSIRYSTIKNNEAARIHGIEYPEIRVTFFFFNTSLSNLYNNVVIYEIKKSRENSFVCERIYRIFLFML